MGISSRELRNADLRIYLPRGISQTYSVLLEELDSGLRSALIFPSVVMKLRKYVWDEAPVLVLSTDNGKIRSVSAEAGGQFYIRFWAEDTLDLPSKCFYDILAKDEYGESYLLCENCEVFVRDFSSRDGDE